MSSFQVVSMEPMVTVPYGRPGAGGYREHDILVVNDDGTVDNITKFPLGPEHNIIPVWVWKFSSSMAVRSELDLWLLIQIFATLETEWFHTSPFTSPYLWDLYWGFVGKPFHWWWVSIETRLDWHPHTGASHYCVTLTPPHPPLLSHASLPLSPFSASLIRMPLHLSLFHSLTIAAGPFLTRHSQLTIGCWHILYLL